MSSGWKPHSKTIEILNSAMGEIHKVDYAPSGRWLFYQLVQKGIIEKTKKASVIE
jgi:hypothetical protein